MDIPITPKSALFYLEIFGDNNEEAIALALAWVMGWLAGTPSLKMAKHKIKGLCCQESILV